MISSLWKNPFTRLIGATLILLGTSALPSKATQLSGFRTYGDMMNGMRVTASFWDGTFQSSTWRTTGGQSGGAFGSGWSVIISGDSFDSPWTLSNSGQGITSLVIDAIPGNTVFDIIPPPNYVTPGSAEGWEFQTLNGQNPNFFAYSDTIDISQGDLFGRLSLYWTNGFTGKMQFRADTDSGTSNNPVQAKDPGVINVPPTVYFSAPPIYEGQWAQTFVNATDPGEGAIAFFLNGRPLGTDFTRAGTRSINTNLGYFADNGDYYYTAQARDEEGNYSNPVTSILKVLNVPPTLTAFNLSSDTIYQGQSVSGLLQATDPGADSINFWINDKYVGTDGNTSGTRSLGTNLGTFIDVGDYKFTGLSQDKDGAFSNSLTRTLKVLNVAPTITQLTGNLIVKQNELFDFAATAIDPGIHDLLTYNWDFNLDGLFDDFQGPRGNWSFATAGKYQVKLRVSDNNGGYTDDFFTVEVEKVPEPSSVLAVLAFGAFSAGSLWQHQRKN